MSYQLGQHIKIKSETGETQTLIVQPGRVLNEEYAFVSQETGEVYFEHHKGFMWSQDPAYGTVDPVLWQIVD